MFGHPLSTRDATTTPAARAYGDARTGMTGAAALCDGPADTHDLANALLIAYLDRYPGRDLVVSEPVVTSATGIPSFVIAPA